MDAICPRCEESNESRDCIFLDCTDALLFWKLSFQMNGGKWGARAMGKWCFFMLCKIERKNIGLLLVLMWAIYQAHNLWSLKI